MRAPRSAAYLSAMFYPSLTITSESNRCLAVAVDDPGVGDAVPESAVEVQNHGVDSASKWRVLFAGCLAHITHDGFTDMLYVFFPIWQQAFALSFFEVGLLKTAFSGTMSLLQIPAGILARRMGILKVLCLGTLLTGAAVTTLGFAGVPLMIGVLLVLGGMGSSTQHPLASSAISNAYQGKASRVALSTYNFSGDIGKLIIPATAALLIAHVGWRPALHLLGGVGFLAAAVILIVLPRIPLASVAGKAQAGADKGRTVQRRLAAVRRFVRHRRARQRHAHGLFDLSAVSAARQRRDGPHHRVGLEPDLRRWSVGKIRLRSGCHSRRHSGLRHHHGVGNRRVAFSACWVCR